MPNLCISLNVVNVGLFFIICFGIILEIFLKNCKTFTFDIFTCYQGERKKLVALYFTVEYKR